MQMVLGVLVSCDRLINIGSFAIDEANKQPLLSQPYFLHLVDNEAKLWINLFVFLSSPVTNFTGFALFHLRE